MSDTTQDRLIISSCAAMFLIGLLLTSSVNAETVNLLTIPPGLSSYTISVAQGQLISKKTNIKVIVQPTQGPRVIPSMMENRDGETGTLSAFVTYWAYTGTGEYKKPYKFIRVLQSGDPTYFGIVTRGDTNIKTIPDLKKKRITYMVTSLAGKNIMEKQLEAYGLDPKKDVTLLKAEDSSFSFKDLASGRTDAVACTLGGSKMVELGTKFKIVLLPFPAEKVPALQKQLPGIFPSLTPPDYGVDAGIPGVVTPMLLIARDDLSNDIAYQMVKALIDNYNELKLVNPALAEWKAEAAVRELPIPYHPGAIKFYKEKGLWGPKMDQLQQQLLAK